MASRLRDARVLISIAVAFIVLIALFGLNHDRAAGFVDSHLRPDHRPHSPPPKPHHVPGINSHDGEPDQEHAAPSDIPEGPERLAYVTWLSSTVAGENSENLEEDNYFVATRLLVWQLLHNEKTRTTNNIDVVVVVTPDVSDSRIMRLKKDGAIVKHIEFVHGNNDGWLHPSESRWSDIMSKLRVWQLTDYSRILMLDGDMVLQRPLDGIFDEPDAQIVPTLTNVTAKDDEPELPEDYLLASFGETYNEDHGYPPDWDHGLKKYGKFCAGFFMLKPSEKIFNYYKALLDIEGRFDSKYMEQNLLNYAHRWDGAMPWREIPTTWNIRSINDHDFDEGVASMHEKWWDLIFSKSEKIMNFMKSQRWQMEGYYKALDEKEELKKGPMSRVMRRMLQG